MLQILFWSKREITKKEKVILNIVIITIPLIFLIVYPNIGTILGYVGACTGFLIMYVLPVMVHLKRIKTKITNPLLAEAIDMNAFIVKGKTERPNSPTGNPVTPKLRIRDDFLKQNRPKLGEIERQKKDDMNKYYLQCVLHSVIPVYVFLILFF